MAYMDASDMNDLMKDIMTIITEITKDSSNVTAHLGADIEMLTSELDLLKPLNYRVPIVENNVNSILSRLTLIDDDILKTVSKDAVGTVTVDALQGDNGELLVNDKRIILNLDNPTDYDAHGGGIIIKGDSDKSILYDYPNDRIVFSEAIDVPDITIAGQPLPSQSIVSSTNTLGLIDYTTYQLIGGGSGGSIAFTAEPSDIPGSLRYVYDIKHTSNKNFKFVLNNNENLNVLEVDNNTIGIAWKDNYLIMFNKLTNKKLFELEQNGTIRTNAGILTPQDDSILGEFKY